MAVDEQTVRRVAKLSRIAVPEDRLAALAGELSGLMDWIEQLREVDVTGVEPMTTTVAMALPLREDRITDGGKSEAILRNAPRATDGFFVMPKVVE